MTEKNPGDKKLPPKLNMGSEFARRKIMKKKPTKLQMSLPPVNVLRSNRFRMRGKRKSMDKISSKSSPRIDGYLKGSQTVCSPRKQKKLFHQLGSMSVVSPRKMQRMKDLVGHLSVPTPSQAIPPKFPSLRLNTIGSKTPRVLYNRNRSPVPEMDLQSRKKRSYSSSDKVKSLQNLKDLQYDPKNQTYELSPPALFSRLDGMSDSSPKSLKSNTSRSSFSSSKSPITRIKTSSSLRGQRPTLLPNPNLFSTMSVDNLNLRSRSSSRRESERISYRNELSDFSNSNRLNASLTPTASSENLEDERINPEVYDNFLFDDEDTILEEEEDEEEEEEEEEGEEEGEGESDQEEMKRIVGIELTTLVKSISNNNSINDDPKIKIISSTSPTPSNYSAGSSDSSVANGIFGNGNLEKVKIRKLRKTKLLPSIRTIFILSLKKFILKKIHPKKWVRRTWSIFMLVVISLYSAVISTRAFFFENSMFYLLLDYSVITIYIIDCFFQVFLYSYTRTKLESDVEKVKFIPFAKYFLRYYFTKWFWIDHLPIIPFEFIGYIFFIKYYQFFLLIRLIKLLRLFSFIENIQLSTRQIAPSYFKLLRSLLITLLSSHFMACFYYVVIYIEGSECSDEFIIGGVDILKMSLVRSYIRCFFWSFVTMTGYSNTQPISNLETICSLIVSAIGILLYITIIGTVGSLVSNLDIQLRQYRKRVDEVTAFMNFRDLPSKLRDQISEYHKYIWETRKSFEETKILSDLELNLKIAVARDINKEVIQSVSFFKDSPDDFVDYIALYLRPRVAIPNVYVIQTGDIGTEMFFITKGSVAVELPKNEKKMNNNKKNILKRGDFFGELSLLYDTKRNASIKTLSFCDFYVINKKHFQRIINRREFMEEKMRIMEFSKDRYSGPPAIQVTCSNGNIGSPINEDDVVSGID